MMLCTFDNWKSRWRQLCCSNSNHQTLIFECPKLKWAIFLQEQYLRWRRSRERTKDAVKDRVPRENRLIVGWGGFLNKRKGDNDRYWFNSKLIFHYKVLQGQSVLPLADVKVSGEKIRFASKSWKTLNVLLWIDDILLQSSFLHFKPPSGLSGWSTFKI